MNRGLHNSFVQRSEDLDESLWHRKLQLLIATLHDILCYLRDKWMCCIKWSLAEMCSWVYFTEDIGHRARLKNCHIDSALRPLVRLEVPWSPSSCIMTSFIWDDFMADRWNISYEAVASLLRTQSVWAVPMCLYSVATEFNGTLRSGSCANWRR